MAPTASTDVSICLRTRCENSSTTIVDDKATVKKFIDDRANGQVVLMAQSAFDYDPIYLGGTMISRVTRKNRPHTGATRTELWAASVSNLAN
jgi:hypothetical protein